RRLLDDRQRHAHRQRHHPRLARRAARRERRSGRGRGRADGRRAARRGAHRPADPPAAQHLSGVSEAPPGFGTAFCASPYRGTWLQIWGNERVGTILAAPLLTAVSGALTIWAGIRTGRASDCERTE